MSKSSVKSLRFFCENCGAEVPRDEQKCPKCGRLFASIRCPRCDFAGEENLFKSGCPVCGYSSNGNSSPETGGQFRFPDSKKQVSSLPIWSYILTAAVFTALLAALLFVIFR